MHSILVTPAIVVRSWSFGESDKIVSFLTAEYGKVTGIAKGAKRSRRRFVNTLEPFSLVQLSFRDRPHTTLAFIHACDLIRPHKNLTTSLEKIACASYLMEVTDAFATEREESRSLFDHLKEGLIWVEDRGPSHSFLAFYELKLLGLAGYQPALESCRRCRRTRAGNSPGHWRFSARDGGLLCASCSALRKEAVPLSAEAIEVLVAVQRAKSILSDHASFSSAALTEGRSVLRHFIQFQTSRELKSASFLDTSSLTW
ncbi:MAG: DNA repair protein RecO [Deltaproteobacteria bacterium]|nr:DNA repair protein RecO [Deltaproteobacteria bacterium]